MSGKLCSTLGTATMNILKCLTAGFQHFVNEIFCDLLYVCVVGFLDGILIFSSDLSAHRQHDRTILQHLQDQDN